jgi:hypothetical protein
MVPLMAPERGLVLLTAWPTCIWAVDTLVPFFEQEANARASTKPMAAIFNCFMFCLAFMFKI